MELKSESKMKHIPSFWARICWSKDQNILVSSACAKQLTTSFSIVWGLIAGYLSKIRQDKAPWIRTPIWQNDISEWLDKIWQQILQVNNLCLVWAKSALSTPFLQSYQRWKQPATSQMKCLKSQYSPCSHPVHQSKEQAEESSCSMMLWGKMTVWHQHWK